MGSLCETRAVKVLKHLQGEAPTTISRSSLSALEGLPSSVLASLHATSDWNSVTDDPELKSWLVDTPIPDSEEIVGLPSTAHWFSSGSSFMSRGGHFRRSAWPMCRQR